MIRKISLLLSLVFAVFVSDRVLAQEGVTTEQLAQNVSSYCAQSYTTPVVSTQPKSWRYAVDASSLENKSALQVGGGLPGLTVLAMLDMLFVDFGDDVSPDMSLRGRLADSRYYWSKTRAVTSLTLDYGYRVRDWLSLGAKGAVGFTTRARRHVATNDILYRDSRVAASLLFNMRFEWLHRRSFMMYSSFGVGATSIFDFSNGLVIPMFDATYVGFTAGRKFYYFLELGGGASGTIRTGVGCRF
jgi:hypothetical protein